MDRLKQLLFNRFKTYVLIALFMGMCIILLMVRIKLAHSFFYMFLVWNLFLAFIPFAITSYLVSLPKVGKAKLLVWFTIWLLFLPNAPYMVTDLIHLRLSEVHILWLDIVVVSCFALTGLFLFYLSVMDMKSLAKSYIKVSFLSYGNTFLFFLTGFGVYLGRFLRYNSWELISNPMHLFTDVLDIVFNPMSNKSAWLFTLVFGLFLHSGFWVYKQFYSNPSTYPCK